MFSQLPPGGQSGACARAGEHPPIHFASEGQTIRLALSAFDGAGFECLGHFLGSLVRVVADVNDIRVRFPSTLEFDIQRPTVVVVEIGGAAGPERVGGIGRSCVAGGGGAAGRWR
jgi:hypothetical protein